MTFHPKSKELDQLQWRGDLENGSWSTLDDGNLSTHREKKNSTNEAKSPSFPTIMTLFLPALSCFIQATALCGLPATHRPAISTVQFRTACLARQLASDSSGEQKVSKVPRRDAVEFGAMVYGKLSQGSWLTTSCKPSIYRSSTV